MCDLPLLVARSGSDTAKGYANRADTTQLRGAVIDICGSSRSLVGCPSAGERILEKTVAKVIRKFCIACKGRYLLTAMLGTASVE